MIAKSYYWIDSHNLKAAAKTLPAQESEVRAGEALILILRECMNEMERSGIELGLKRDAARNDDGSIDPDKL